MVRCEKLGVVLRPEKSSQAKFNPGMVDASGEIHVLYRFCEKRKELDGKAIDWSSAAAQGEFPYVVNHIRHATLNEDGSLRKDDDAAVIFPEHPWEALGCEDARIVPFGGSWYIFYCAYDGRKARQGIAQTLDFRRYEKIGIIDNVAFDKDAFIFPERIDGRIAYMHRIAPNIQIDYFDDLEQMLDPARWNDYEARVEQSTVLRCRFPFDATRVGGGVPPIRTERGWLLIYHGVDAGRIYHAGAALLDLGNPSRVTARLPYPILSPEADYEMRGDYEGCVFPQGHFIRDGGLYISYGAADMYAAVARIDLESLLNELGRHPFDA